MVFMLPNVLWAWRVTSTYHRDQSPRLSGKTRGMERQKGQWVFFFRHYSTYNFLALAWKWPLSAAEGYCKLTVFNHYGSLLCHFMRIWVVTHQHKEIIVLKSLQDQNIRFIQSQFCTFMANALIRIWFGNKDGLLVTDMSNQRVRPLEGNV